MQSQQGEGGAAEAGARGENFLVQSMVRALGDVARLRGDRNVVLYGTAFLQKPSVPAETSMMTNEDINGWMGVIHKMDWSKNLTIILHTPGGQTSSVDPVVSYFRQKFTDIEIIVPTFAMSAGTMMCLAADRLVMGRQSQLGPIDPQMPAGGGTAVSARAIVEQFERARAEVLVNAAAVNVWGPILGSLGPSLLVEAQNALDYSEDMVARWLALYACAKDPDPTKKAKEIAHHFNDAQQHKSHARRIDRVEASDQGLTVEHLEDSQDLQEAVLTTYHLMTIWFEQSPMTKILWSSTGATWMKNWTGTAAQN